MQYFTQNPALPHPDSEHEPQPWELNEAISWAIKVLRDPTADQWTRTRAADELQFSHGSQEPTE
jgi:hypothetical protein